MFAAIFFAAPRRRLHLPPRFRCCTVRRRCLDAASAITPSLMIFFIDYAITLLPLMVLMIRR